MKKIVRNVILLIALINLDIAMSAALFAQTNNVANLTIEGNAEENIVLKVARPSNVEITRIYIKVGTQYLGEDVYKKVFDWASVLSTNQEEISLDTDKILVNLGPMPINEYYFNVLLQCTNGEIYVGRTSKNVSNQNNQ